MASAPAHPIALQSALRVLHATAKAATWAANRARKLRALDLRVRHAQAMTSPSGAELRMAQDDLAKLQATTVLTPLAGGGPVSVLDWTGPGVWTDATLDYLAVKYGVKWVDLRGLTVPTRIGDVLVLPVTGFSPGVGQFGAGEATGEYMNEWMVNEC
jgi:alpha 1,6-mannosyltransferase